MIRKFNFLVLRSRNRYAYGILKTMKGGTKPHGFTIVETLLFIAISGVLFGAALNLISGKQNETEFSQGMKQIDNTVQGVMSNVAEGQYTNISNFTCIDATVSLPPQISASGTNTQGTNLQCSLVGEAIQFQTNQFIVYPMVGDTYSNLTALTPATTLKAAHPTPLVTSTVDDSSTTVLPYGITAHSVDGRTGNPSTVGIFSIGSIVPGSNSSIQLISVGTKLTNSKVLGIARLRAPSNYSGSLSLLPNGTTICFNSGTTKQSGLVTIGGAGNPTNVNMTIASGVCP